MLKGKVALVTGGSRGIGSGIALCLSKYGAHVALSYRKEKEQAEKVCTQIRENGVNTLAIQADVTRVDDIRRMVQETERVLGPIDILVNNAGHNPLHSIDTMNEQGWDEVLSVNLKSYFMCSKIVIEGMVGRGEGHIINITSISGQRGGLSCDVDYSAAKAGIMGFTRCLARWAAPRGILVNAVAPGYIMTDNLRQVSSPARLAEMRSWVPLGRLGEPEDVGEVVAMLSGPAGRYIVGEVISVNGGVHIA